MNIEKENVSTTLNYLQQQINLCNNGEYPFDVHHQKMYTKGVIATLRLLCVITSQEYTNYNIAIGFPID